MNANEFFQAIQNGKDYRASDIFWMIDDEFERFNAERMFADFVSAIGKSYLLQPLTQDKFNPAQPRDWRGRWTTTGAGGGPLFHAPPKDLPFGELALATRSGMEALLSGTMTVEGGEAYLARLGEEAHRRTSGLTTAPLSELESELERSLAFMEARGTFDPAENAYLEKLGREIEARKDDTHKPIAEGAKPWAYDRLGKQRERIRKMTEPELRAEAKATEEYIDKISAEYRAKGDNVPANERNEFYKEIERVDEYRDELKDRGAYFLESKLKGSDDELFALAATYDDPNADYDSAMRKKINRELERREMQRIKEEASRQSVAGERERAAQVEAMGLRDRTPGQTAVAYDLASQQRDIWSMPDEGQLSAWSDKIKGSDVAIAFDASIAENIIEDGFLNQHATETSGGMIDPEARTNLEAGLWDIERRPFSEYPVYGFLTEPNGTLIDKQSLNVGQYGNVIAILKPEMDERTTFTIGDSLNNNMWFRDGIEYAEPENIRLPSPKLAPSDLSIANTFNDNGFIPTPREVAGEYVSGAEYIEAQIHGGNVTVDKIKEIRFPTKKEHIFQSESRYKAAKAFAEKGIPVFAFGIGGEGGWVTLTPAEFAQFEREQDDDILRELGLIE